MSKETTRLIRDGEKEGWGFQCWGFQERGMEMDEERDYRQIIARLSPPVH